MVLTAMQIMAFFTGNNNMAILPATVVQLAQEGIDVNAPDKVRRARLSYALLMPVVITYVRTWITCAVQLYSTRIDNEYCNPNP